MFTFKSSIYDKIACFLVLDHVQQFPSLNHVLVYDLRKCQNFQKAIIKKAFQLLIFSIKATFRNLVLIVIYLFLIQLIQAHKQCQRFHKLSVFDLYMWMNFGMQGQIFLDSLGDNHGAAFLDPSFRGQTPSPKQS